MLEGKKKRQNDSPKINSSSVESCREGWGGSYSGHRVERRKKKTPGPWENTSVGDLRGERGAQVPILEREEKTGGDTPGKDRAGGHPAAS